MRLLALCAPLLALGAGEDGTCQAEGGCRAAAARGEARAPSPALPGDRPCREVLGAVEAGEAKAWTRAEPVVFTGLAERAGWDVDSFGEDRLRQAFGKERVKVFSPAQAALLAGQTSRRHPVRYVLSKLRDPEQLLYVFDPDFFKGAAAKKIARIPKWLAMDGGDQLLTLGGPRSGAHFHAHGPAFLTLFAGHKRWYFHRPGRFPNATVSHLDREVAVWEDEVLPQLQGAEAPLSCVQQPGDTVFVPDSWAHATTNLDDTVGVAWQRFTTGTDTCKEGHDYMCLLQKLSSVKLASPASQPARYQNLFAAAEEVSGGFAAGFLRFLGPFWQVSKEGKHAFQRQLARLKEMVKAAKPHTDQAILAAALAKAMVDALFTAHPNRPDKAAALLQMATRKAPEAGLGVSLAQLYGKQGKWNEAAEQLVAHLAHFPEDVDANTMLGQARQFAAKR